MESSSPLLHRNGEEPGPHRRIEAGQALWADSMDVQLAPEGTEIESSQEVEPGVVLDLDAEERIVGIEVLGASARVAGVAALTEKPAA